MRKLAQLGMAIMLVATFTSCELKEKLEGATTISLNDQLIIQREKIVFSTFLTYSEATKNNPEKIIGSYLLNTEDIKNILDDPNASILKGVKLREIRVEHIPEKPDFQADREVFDSFQQIYVKVTNSKKVVTTIATLKSNTNGLAIFMCGNNGDGFNVLDYMNNNQGNILLEFCVDTDKNLNFPVFLTITGDLKIKLL